MSISYLVEASMNLDELAFHPRLELGFSTVAKLGQSDEVALLEVGRLISCNTSIAIQPVL
jgi:hypothetical protein